jgi:hypothetical protein
MLFTVLGNYGRETGTLPMPPMPDAVAVAPGTPPPLSAKVTRVLICSVFFGPFGALAGTGIGLLVSGLRGDFRQNRTTNPGQTSHRENASSP